MTNFAPSSSLVFLFRDHSRGGIVVSFASLGRSTHGIWRKRTASALRKIRLEASEGNPDPTRYCLPAARAFRTSQSRAVHSPPAAQRFGRVSLRSAEPARARGLLAHRDGAAGSGLGGPHLRRGRHAPRRCRAQADLDGRAGRAGVAPPTVWAGSSPSSATAARRCPSATSRARPARRTRRRVLVAFPSCRGSPGRRRNEPYTRAKTGFDAATTGRRPAVKLWCPGSLERPRPHGADAPPQRRSDGAAQQDGTRP
jgi:hypothetical protein